MHLLKKKNPTVYSLIFQHILCRAFDSIILEDEDSMVCWVSTRVEWGERMMKTMSFWCSYQWLQNGSLQVRASFFTF